MGAPLSIYVQSDPDVISRLDAVLGLLGDLKRQGDQLMTRSDEVKAIVTRLDGASNELAKDLKDLRDKIAAGTVTAADLAELDRVTAALEALGKDPENPIPTPAPPAA